MIVPMRKAHVVVRSRDRQRLLEALRALGVVHLVPVTAVEAPAHDSLAVRIQALESALHVLHGVPAHGPQPAIDVLAAANEVLEIQRRHLEHGHRLAALHHQLEQLSLWGNVELSRIAQLREAGVDVQFYAVPERELSQVQAECMAHVGTMPDGREMLAIAIRDVQPQLPASAAVVPPPPRDAPSIRAEAGTIDAARRADQQRLGELAHQAGAMQAELQSLRRQAAFVEAERGGLGGEALFAIQGWLPAEAAPSLPEELTRAGVPAAVELLEVAEDEQPPTLIRPPAWARPIEGLFRVLGTVAGYREFDVSVPFLIGVPIFTAVLIGDAGYGLVLLLALTFGYRQAAKLIGQQFAQLLIIVAVATIGWGLVSATFFGAVWYRPWVPVDLSESSRLLMMRICFVVGAAHLSVARLWPAIKLYPDLRWLNQLGWAVFIWGMLGVVQMFVLRTPFHWGTPWPYLLLSGAALAIGFHHPSRNVLVAVGLGIANFPLSMLSSFSDVISYVRLMAVGLASSVLGASVNQRALDFDSWPLVVLVLLLGHSLNLGLAMIAMFAHGVRLNMLEFCNNLGMQWTGYSYAPFSEQTPPEN